MVAKGSKKAKCNWCGNTYFRKANAQKYCSPECKHNARLLTQCKATAKYRKTYGRPNEVGGVYIMRGNALINSTLGATRQEDFVDEQRIVHRIYKQILGSEQCKNRVFGQV